MGELVLESAVPQHLQVPRICPKRMPTDYQPAFPAFCARFSADVQTIVMAIFGAQHRSTTEAEEAKALTKILSFINESKAKSEQPKHYDLASVSDAQGLYNECVVAYWDDQSTYEAWRKSSGFDQWWVGLDPAKERHGWFQEIFLPSIDRAESLYSSDQPGVKEPEGHGVMGRNLSGMIQEHVYWGSMRDRLPISQTDELVGEKATEPDETDPSRSRIRVPGKQNLCLIRSGQDWSRTKPEEHKLYTDTMHPVLVEGMNFLRDHGEEVGCYSCRLMDVLDPKTAQKGTEKTFGLAYFDDIASLENWSKEHKTHLKIFHGFLQYVEKLNFDVTLHLYHEVYVLKPEQQVLEYIGCQPGTGMLGGLRDRA